MHSDAVNEVGGGSPSFLQVFLPFVFRLPVIDFGSGCPPAGWEEELPEGESPLAASTMVLSSESVI